MNLLWRIYCRKSRREDELLITIRDRDLFEPCCVVFKSIDESRRWGFSSRHRSGACRLANPEAMVTYLQRAAWSDSFHKSKVSNIFSFLIRVLDIYECSAFDSKSRFMRCY